jgi:predicted phosphoribosyltransferase
MQALIAVGDVELNETITTDFDSQLLWGIIEKQQSEIARRQETYRQGKKLPSLKKKTIILVDDGIATGYTLKAAIKSLQKQDLKELIVVVPVSTQDAAQTIKQIVDKFICPHIPADFMAVGQFYTTFPQTTDEEVLEILKKYKK